MKPISYTSRTAALCAVFCLLMASLITDVAVAVCPCPGMGGTPDPLAFGIIALNKPVEKEVFFSANQTVKVGAAKIFLENKGYTISNNKCTGDTLSPVPEVSCAITVAFEATKPETYDNTLEVIYEIESNKCTEKAKVSLEGAGS